ncbi:hypothetical protein NDU88_002256 [Pleurodeles waltl]|uniref:Uncharacterized protein n=1 Tax=Pleurodeles waltl TaxID=8319 RepID=A0AAV7UV22_PLEWA|nr:hypothetical protein NDU88_002256 [Pleurodeles waltl]
MGRGTVSGRDPASRQPFRRALCSSPLRRSCPGRPECTFVCAARCLPSCAGRAPGLNSTTRSLSVGSSAGQNPGMCSGVPRASPLLLTSPPTRVLSGPGRPERGRRPTPEWVIRFALAASQDSVVRFFLVC